MWSSRNRLWTKIKHTVHNIIVEGLVWTFLSKIVGKDSDENYLVLKTVNVALKSRKVSVIIGLRKQSAT